MTYHSGYQRSHKVQPEMHPTWSLIHCHCLQEGQTECQVYTHASKTSLMVKRLKPAVLCGLMHSQASTDCHKLTWISLSSFLNSWARCARPAGKNTLQVPINIANRPFCYTRKRAWNAIIVRSSTSRVRLGPANIHSHYSQCKFDRKQALAWMYRARYSNKTNIARNYYSRSSSCKLSGFLEVILREVTAVSGESVTRPPRWSTDNCTMTWRYSVGRLSAGEARIKPWRVVY